MSQERTVDLIVDLFAGGGGASTALHLVKGHRGATHGLSRTPEYRAWQQMRLRCMDPEHEAFGEYGARGITVCERWLNDVEAFYADMGPKPSPVHELDRIENDKGYEPGNCRWATRKINCRNRRSNRLVTLDGETRTLAEWCELRGLPRDTVQKRLGAGWSAEKALSTPARPKAAAGDAKPQTHACSGCRRHGCWGERCRSCENRRRWQARAA